MEHGPATEWGEDKASGYKQCLGLWMFAVYSIVYAAFVIINSIYPKLMGKSIGGLNLAVIYGIGLIVVALILAVIYNALSTRAERRFNNPNTDTEEEKI